MHGDRNTKFFHMSTIIRRTRNRVEMLKKDENQWVSDAQELEKLAVDYLKKNYILWRMWTQHTNASGDEICEAYKTRSYES